MKNQMTMFDIPEPVIALDVVQDTFDLDTASDEIILKLNGRQ